MIEIDEALALYACELRPLPIETVAVGTAIQRVLAESVTATTDLPRFDQSAMDGYAFAAAALHSASSATPCWLPIVQRIAAGAAPGSSALPAGSCARILTGAPLPPGADTVIPQENVQLDGERLRFTVAYPCVRNVRRRGE